MLVDGVCVDGCLSIRCGSAGVCRPDVGRRGMCLLDVDRRGVYRPDVDRRFVDQM